MGRFVYSWGYGCNGAPAGYAPAAISGAFCNNMQSTWADFDHHGTCIGDYQRHGYL